MIGLPMDILPEFPADADMVLITEQAKGDPEIIKKIQTHLQAGKSVCVTSGFVRAMRGRGIEDIIEIEATGAYVPIERFAFASGPGAPFGFGRGRRGGASDGPDPFAATRNINIPEIKYFNILTHDAWGDVLGVTPGGTTYPILLSCDYSKGKFYVLTLPTDFADLYAFPPAALGVIRAALGAKEPIRIDSAPAQVALFRYDNNTFIVQNYLPTAAEATISVEGTAGKIRNLLTGEETSPAPQRQGGFGRRFGRRAPAGPPPRISFNVALPAHSYRAFAVE
jgi:hypothetical protein